MQAKSIRIFPTFYIVIAFLCVALRLSATVQRPAEALPFDLDRGTVSGGALGASRRGNGWELAVSRNDKAGQWTADVVVNLDTYPLLVFQVPELSRECAWSLSISETGGRNKQLLQKDAASFGQFEFDLSKTPGWTGTRRLRLDFNVRGPGGWILIQQPAFCRRTALSLKGEEQTSSVLQSERMNRALVNASPQEVSLSLMNAKGPEWEWGGALSKPSIDTDKYPFAELDVRSLSPNGSFRFGVGGMTSGPVDRNAAVLSFNYRDPSRWQGRHEVPILLIVSGSGTRLVYRPIRFLPYPSLSAGLVNRADTASTDETAGEKDLITGGLLLRYEPKNGLFRIRRKDGKASLVTRFLEMDGLNLGADIGASLRKTKSATGERLTYERQTDRVTYSFEVETMDGVEGLLHWRVTATPSVVTHLSSCGHELCYVPSGGSVTPILRRIAAQSWSGSGLAFVEAPGVGTALYFQNYTALNPVFERCHIAPRFWVSASARTFGFPAPLDTRAAFPAGQPVVLSDAWLYVAPEEHGAPTDTLQGNRRDATLFLQGLAAIYARLPDRPPTEWLDWQKLARRSLQDLYNGECWSSWENGIYLKSYVGTVGASPQLTGMQDVIGPILAFMNMTGEGRDMYDRLRAEIPHFWSDKRNSLLLFANDPTSNWWSLEQIVGVCRAAQNGDAEAKKYCLQAADTFIRMGRDSHYGFQRFSEIKDMQNDEREYAGVFILYMMLLHELSGEARFVEEAKHAADQIHSWDFPSAKLAAWSAMTCEGLARLYAATGDKQYVYDSFIPLAGLLRNAWLWECDYGHAKGYTTFFGFNSDAGGVDYITAADQHQVWHSLYQYYLLAYPVMPAFARLLVAEAVRCIPQVAWYTYPPNLPPESLHEGVPFWHSKNIFSLAIPVEDLNDGWRKNGSVGQELYGAGAAFDIASNAYIRVPEAGLLIFCEYPVLKTEWLGKEKVIDFEIGGLPQQEVKVEVRWDPRLGPAAVHPDLDKLKLSSALADLSQALTPRKTAIENDTLRTTVPGGSRFRISLP
jgi:hypothetical protein